MPPDPPDPTPYQIELRDEHWDAVRSWDQSAQERFFTFLRDHASRTPTARLGRNVKRLKAPWARHYQFRIDRDRRFVYRVDEEERRVIAVYVGPHPDWRKSRRGRITP